MLYKIGELIGYLIILIFKLIKAIWNFWFTGTFKICKRYKPMIIVYIVLIGIMAVCFIKVINSPPSLDNGFLYNNTFHNTFYITLNITYLVIIVSAIVEYIKEYPVKKKEKYYMSVFEEISLYSQDKNGANIIPRYLYEQDISDYLKAISFSSLAPLELWNRKKEVLEMHLNTKILEIRQSEKHLQIIEIIIQKKKLSELIYWNDKYVYLDKNILSIGFGLYGLCYMDLEKYPHAFIAGETGAGKSNLLKCLIHQSIEKGYKTVLIDFKRGVSFAQFSNMITVYYEYDTVVKVLQDMVNETKRRLDIFREFRVDNLNDYNKLSIKPLERIIIFIDELAELLKTRDKETANILNDSIETLTRLSRAAGIHLIMGIQRPDSKVVDGQIKNNTPFRICGRFTDREPSRIMLASDIASTLSNIKGRFIVKDNNLYEVQCFYFPNDTPTTANNKADESVSQNANGEVVSNGVQDIEFDFSDIE